MAEVTMPKLSDTMEEGKILRWLKHAGDQVEVGDLLVEVETDKADMEVEASAAGVLREVKLGEGDSAPVGAVIAVIESGGDGTKRADAPAKEPERPKQATKGEGPTKQDAAADRNASTKDDGDRGRNARPAPAESAPPQRKTTPPPAAAASSSRPAASHDVKASPLARSLADELGVDLAGVRGTGPAGRVTRRDVEEAHARAQQPAKAASAKPTAASGERAAAAASPTAADEPRETRDTKPAPRESSSGETAKEPSQASSGVRRVPLSRMRASIAKRMTESMRDAPHFYLTTVVDMDEAVRLRAQLKTLEVSSAGVTYNHMVVKATADALRAFPEVNARFAGEAIELLDEVNVGIATAVDDGLIVPVLQGADRLSLLEIAAEARALADKAEGGRFTSAELSGATFSVSNLGMFDVDSFTAVINPPQAAILAVGSVKQRPIVRGGGLAVGHTMSMTLSCDHRVIDGARGGRFLAEVKRRLENPAALLLSGHAEE